MSKVASIHGGPAGEREVIAPVVEYLKGVLERAEAGEVVGVAVVEHFHDKTAGYDACGVLASFSMLGAADGMHHELRRCILEDLGED